MSFSNTLIDCSRECCEDEDEGPIDQDVEDGHRGAIQGQTLERLEPEEMDGDKEGTSKALRSYTALD